MVDGRDVMVFRTLADAERFVEPQDAASGALELYDADGRVLEPMVQEQTPIIGGRTTRYTVRFPETVARERLRYALDQFAASAGVANASELSDKELMELLME